MTTAGAATDKGAPGTPPPVVLRAWLSVLTLALGMFAMVTVEGLPVGLLPSMSSDLDVSEGMVGLSVTIPGLVAAATAPVLPLVIRTLDRRAVLLGLILLIVLANLLTATASSFEVLLVSRFFVGVSIGGFWALAAGVAVRLVPEAHTSRALAITFTGATAANVIGIPAGALIGELADWRVAFLTVGGLAVVAAIAILTLVPALPPTKPIGLQTLLAQLRHPGVRSAVTATFLLVGAHFAAFTFVSPALRTLAGVEGRHVGPMLLAFGIAAVVGTLVVGSLAGRDVRRSIIALSILFAAVLAGFPLIGTSPVVALVLLILWGIAFGGVPVAVQTWIVESAGVETEAATALNTSAYNLAIAGGALAGSVVVDRVAVAGALWVGATLALLTSLVAWRSRSPGRQPGHRLA